MRILHVIAKMDPELGGVCKAIRTITRVGAENNIIHEVVSLDDPDSDFIKTDPFKIYSLGPAENIWNYNNDLNLWLNKNIFQYKLVIVHGLWLYPSYVIQKIFKNNKKTMPAYYVMPHGMLDPYFQKAEGRKLKAYRNWLYWKMIENKTVSNATGLLFTCEEEKELASKSFEPYTPKKEIVIGLGVESPPDYEISMAHAFYKICPDVIDHPYILFLSRINEKKGLINLLKAYIKIHEESNSSNKLPKLVIAGPGMDSNYGIGLKHLINEHPKISKKVKFVGMIKDRQKWGAFYHSQAFILPSHQENFGIAIVEALACSKPVLISDKVNIWREIEDANAGIVEDDSEEGCYNLLKKWISKSTKEKESYSQNALKCYSENFNMAAFSENWKELINKTDIYSFAN
ncbi:glycosyltransferase [Autumnicola psychrophila]|uniref:Glycosyltransferase n=1 Tax=Autumnicola psychrophila TaxID=3075592 RepID=A0ABU3DRE7_9FLAO|nr:glycosyltransferase [Zunongwangia sp. F225]MDT0686054.1 glycosyltransferase [Zunongwangia sp. F225]